ncbi:MAG: hypothetical protein ACOYOH_26860 [Paracraurococcus sp.]
MTGETRPSPPEFPGLGFPTLAERAAGLAHFQAWLALSPKAQMVEAALRMRYRMGDPVTFAEFGKQD